jgi:UDP:flavonoid glycosyltransferase YjiC (YdhE family)
MRIVFRAHPAYGHVYPLMPLAEAARAAGHEVIFPIAPPFLERLRELGYRTIESGVTMVEASRRRFDGRSLQFVIDGEPNWDLYSELFAEAAVHAATDMLRQLPESGVDLIIHEDTDLAGGAVAASLGVPSVVVGTVRSFEQRIHDAFFGRPLAELRALFDATPRLDAPNLDTFPDRGQRPEFLAVPHRRPMRMVPWSDPSYPLPSWIGRRTRKVVFVTMGTVVESAELRRTVVDALATFEVDIVLSAGVASTADLGRLPDNVYVEPYVNQAALLPHLDLIVHHGGAGTTTGGWAAGVPQLVLPDGADRFINADAVVTSGSGLALFDHTPDLIEKAVSALVEDDAYRDAAAVIRDDIAATPHPADVLRELIAAM